SDQSNKHIVLTSASSLAASSVTNATTHPDTATPYTVRLASAGRLCPWLSRYRSSSRTSAANRRIRPCIRASHARAPPPLLPIRHIRGVISGLPGRCVRTSSTLHWMYFLHVCTTRSSQSFPASRPPLTSAPRLTTFWNAQVALNVPDN